MPLPTGFSSFAEMVEFLTQNKRLMQLSFPRDDAPDALLFVDELHAKEFLSQDFVYTLTLLSDDPGIEFKEMNGKLLCVSLDRSDGSKRYFTGHVFQFQRLDYDGALASYRAVLRPWVAFLNYTHDNYIFHYQNTEQQTDTVFNKYQSLRNWNLKLVNSIDPEFTDAFQYDESDYNYVHRRWEDLGWYYWYEHTKEGQQLMLCDWSPTAKNIDGSSNVVIYRTHTGSADEDIISYFAPLRQVVSNEFTAENFNFKSPHPVLSAIDTNNKQGRVPHHLEVYVDTGLYGYKNSALGEQLVKHRMEAIECQGSGFKGKSSNPYFQPGRVFVLDNADYKSLLHNEKEDDLTFLITGVTHTVSNNIRTNMNGATYSNNFSCILRRIPWRPMVTHTQTIDAPQTAIVVGPEGQVIHTDEYGRVRVQFHWDRVGKYDQRSSAWIRTSSLWAGDRYGEMAIPRIGQEVIVQFINGCTDRPVITGRAYNADNMPPWELPSQKALMGYRTQEIEGVGYNNLTLDDTTGKLQAQFSSTYELTQLNIGQITRIDGTPGRKDLRGQGFELRTDAWGAIRAGKGLYISTDKREKAAETQRDIREAIQQLQLALELAKSVERTAKRAWALPSATADQQKQHDEVYQGDLTKPGLLASSPQGIAMTTPKSAQISAEKNITVTSLENTDFSSFADMRVAARNNVSVYAAEKEMKIIAGKNKFLVQSNENGVEVYGKKAVTVSSAKAKIDIGSPKEILMASGGSFLKISGGTITWGCPGQVQVKCSGFSVVGPASKNLPMPSFDTEPLCIECLMRASRLGKKSLEIA